MAAKLVTPEEWEKTVVAKKKMWADIHAAVELLLDGPVGTRVKFSAGVKAEVTRKRFKTYALRRGIRTRTFVVKSALINDESDPGWIFAVSTEATGVDKGPKK